MKDTVYDIVASGDRLQADGSVVPIDAPIAAAYCIATIATFWILQRMDLMFF